MVGGKAMAVRFELLAEQVMVIDFAIEDELDTAILIRHGLAAALDIDDRQTAECEIDVRPLVIACVIRPAPNQSRHDSTIPGLTHSRDLACR